MKKEGSLLPTIILGVVIGNFATLIVTAIVGQTIAELQYVELLPQYILMLFVVFFGWVILKMIRQNR